MRISTTQIYNNLLTGITRQQDLQNTGNAQIASGTRFQTPAQAGLDYKVSLDIRHAQSGITGSLAAVNLINTRLNISQTMLSDMNNVLTRAQTLAVQQSDATMTASQRSSAAIEVTHLISRFLDNANQKWQGQSLFAGTAVDRPAFVDNAVFSAGTGIYAAGANTGISNITQTTNPNAVNDTYAVTLDGLGTSVSSITNALGTELLAAPVLLTTGANAAVLNNGAEISITYSGTPDTANPAGGSLIVSGAALPNTISYNGNDQSRMVAITPEQQVVSNVRGDAQAFTDAFSSLNAFKTALEINDVATIQSSLTTLIAAGDGVVNLTADVGSQISAMSFYKASYQDQQLQLEVQLSNHEAVDVPSVVAQLQQSSIALQAAYNQISQLKSLSLLNYLR